MGTPAYIVMVVLGLGFAVANVAFWWWIARRGDDRARAWASRRYAVTIERGPRGHWRVTADGRSWARRLAIELIQLGVYLGAMVVWALALLVAILVMKLVSPFGR